MAEPLISFENVTLRLNGKLSFENFNWIFGEDQHWVIVGPNGSGKSTLVNALCHKIKPARGRILYFFEKDSHHTGNGFPFFNRRDIVLISPEVQQEFVQQYSGYYQARWQSFEGNNTPTAGELLSPKSIEHTSPYEVTPYSIDEEIYWARRKKAVELLEIGYLLDRKILHLSNGEIRKVLIARAFMQSPKLLILDDPFCGLDKSSRIILNKAIEEMLAAGSPRILLVTARLDEIPQGITHILSVTCNRVVFQGLKESIPEISSVTPTSVSENDPFSELNSVCFPVINLPVDLPEAGTNSPGLNSFIVEMRNVSVTYGGVNVLHDISWTIRQGERWALLGHNGAGKTTLLSMILGDNPQAYANQVSIFGKRRGSGESIWEIKQYIGWVSPELQVFYCNGLTCQEVVCSGFFDSIGLYRDSSPAQDNAAFYWMNILKIEEIADCLFSAVSIGEQRLVLLARALVKKPVLLVLDEPCQGLDFSHCKLITNIVDQLCRQTPVSLIYVTHYFDELPQTITHVLNLEHGQIIENGGIKV